MDFTLGKEREMARQLFRGVSEEEVKPLAEGLEDTGKCPC